ncbi:MAG: hypothetical protein K2W95_26705 [Candidatus Obscuribacterales bacterium]|nr:hypothetical protein [Candidatus Obscuribacterales bacterium]
MKLTHKIVVAAAIVGSFFGGYWTGSIPSPDVDPQPYIRTVFTPDEDGLSAYLGFLDRARTSVHVACYGFTEPQVVDKLIELHKRGVKVRILLDRSQSHGKYQAEQVKRLLDAGIEVVIGTSTKSGQIMHNKFTIIDGLLVEDGSWNYTRSANKQANVLNFVQSKSRAQLFQKQWDKMHDFMSKQKQDL